MEIGVYTRGIEPIWIMAAETNGKTYSVVRANQRKLWHHNLKFSFAQTIASFDSVILPPLQELFQIWCQNSSVANLLLFNTQATVLQNIVSSLRLAIHSNPETNWLFAFYPFSNYLICHSLLKFKVLGIIKAFRIL